MVINSILFDGAKVQHISVEVVLAPGLPQITILGRPSPALKESEKRLRFAIKAQGFRWPKAKQIIVNLRPTGEIKNDLGLELAIAAGILHSTGQIEFNPACYCFYGEVGLEGKVRTEERIMAQNLEQVMVVGEGSHLNSLQIPIKELRDLRSLSLQKPVLPAADVQPSSVLTRQFSRVEADIMSFALLSKDHFLILGPSGVGKTTLARSIIELLTLLRPGLPVVSPHHTASMRALVGGGSGARAGELPRAHGGVLFMDEFLLFAPEVLETLREPMETGRLRLARGQHCREFPACARVIGTSNFCPCGDWNPKNERLCSFSRQRCYSFLRKLNTPIAERFAYIFNLNQENQREISGEEILVRAKRAKDIVVREVPAFSELALSPRRIDALRSAAKIWAALDGREVCNTGDIDRAFDCAFRPLQWFKSY
ncbi:MAG: ATP-binding protein [Bdellovibrionaceae bacterium]|nr:ATP-binding protein [Pseudobdellovibrionaceae bacterium]